MFPRRWTALVLDALADRVAHRVVQRLGTNDMHAPTGGISQIAASTGTMIQLDYPVKPQPRWGAAWQLPAHERLQGLIRADDDWTLQQLRTIASHRNDLQRIPAHTSSPTQPHWCNGWLPGWDGAALYAFTVQRNPGVYLEVGSGNSTKFVRQAILDHGLRTRIVSIDPQPRAEVDAICDEVIRLPLEQVDLSGFDQLGEGDICFIDNSHRAFQNSDVTVSMLEVMPRLGAGVLVGIHDIFLPDDYPRDWSERFYNEQYLLAAFLLGGHQRTRIHLPAFDASRRPEMAGIVNPIWDLPALREAELHGGAFWMLRT